MRVQERGFTLIELIVVILIIGILTAFGIPQYIKSLETSRADDAASLMNMVATANRMYALDHNQTYTSGQLTSSCSESCSSPTPVNPSACELVGCKYLAPQDFDSYTYVISAAKAGSCGAHSGSFVACAQRRSSGCPPASNCTNSSTYGAWGYAATVNGQVSGYGGAPTPVQ